MLTAAEVVETRRHAGYPASVAADDAVSAVLAALTPEAETVVRLTYLPALARLEAALLGTSDTLDTAKAAVWERNPQELLERSGLYRAMRVALCRFLGIEPGPGLYDVLIVDPCGCETGTGGSVGGGTGLALPPAVLVV